ncbi:MAG TPA: hypothetical protein DHV28_03335 [Ignavibacteriales bacterium]|nr:hypothetical protein [Ignavibacteriales bacterium]
MFQSIFTKIFFFISFISTSFLIAQSGSVELKDGSGVFISSHSSIQEAYNAIPAAVTQAYIIEILTAYDGANETYPIAFSLKSGTSEINSITLRPAAGNTGEIISAAASGQPILLLDDADYVIIDGRPGGIGTVADLAFENLGTTSGSYTFRFLNGATNNAISYCIIKNNTMNVAGPRAIEIGTSLSNPTGNSDNIISNNEIIGGRSCIGLAGTAANPNLNIQIVNNKISNFGYAGIWVLSSSSNITIEGNEIFQTIGFNTFNFGIIAAGFTNLDIIGNKIYDIQNTASTSVRGMQITPAAGATLNVVNNFVSLMLDNGTKTNIYGIQILGANDFTANIYYNSVRIGGTHTGGTAGTVISAGIYKGNTGAGSIYNQKNNIVLNTRTGGTAGTFHTGFYVGAVNLVGTYDIDYNVYYGIDATSLHGCWGGNYFSDITLYKAAATPNEQNTIFKPTEFVSVTDLHLTGNSISDSDLTALSIASITDDIDGQVRHSTTPYRGADEADLPIPVELESVEAKVNGNSVSLNWITVTELNNRGFQIERKSNNSDWIKVGFVNGSGTSTEPKSYNYIDQNIMPGIYNYRIKQIDFNGSITYYNLSETIEIGIPEAFDLAQNYPNPFNPITTIKYSVAKLAQVNIVVFNSIGEEIVTLVNEAKQPGSYFVQFNARDVSSGVYFYKLIAGDFISTKKMILIK